MSGYLELIERTRLVRDVQSRTTTGDVAYPGTALEVCDESGKDLFHVVVDSVGEQQVMFFGGTGNYRLSLALLERILIRGKEAVVVNRDDGGEE